MLTRIVWGHIVLFILANGVMAQVGAGGFRPPGAVPGFQQQSTPSAAPVPRTSPLAPPAAGGSLGATVTAPPVGATITGQATAPRVGAIGQAAPPLTRPPVGAPVGAAPANTAPAGTLPVTEVATNPRPATAAVTQRATGELSNAQGQVLRDYSISEYTSKITSTAKPEQAIIDWVLRETGTDVWFSEPLGFFSASKDKVSVYHTPEMQEVVADVVNRFVSSGSEAQVLGLHLATIGSPDWRAQAHPMLRPVVVQTPGIDAWLITKEAAAVLMADLARRSDYQEHSVPAILVENGQSQTLAKIRPRPFPKNVRATATLPGYELEMGKVEEGYSLQISPLVSADSSTIDCVIKCHVDQVERLVPVQIPFPSVNGSARQNVQIQVPQMASYRMHERFRWPTDLVLVVSAGVGPTPGPKKPNPLGIKIPFTDTVPRADAVLFIEYKGKASQNLLGNTVSPTQPNYNGRY